MTYTAENYANVAELIDGGHIEPARPTVGMRSDGVGLFYRGQFNSLFGNPETGKTLVAQCALVDELNRGGSALILDLDHNGASATIARLIAMGADEATLRQPALFRYAAPDDAEQLQTVVRETVTWAPVMVLLDSIGELLPLFGASSNSPDDFTRVHTVVIKPLADCGAAVVGIDHLAKNTESQTYGSTGTAAKKRVVGGTSLRVTVLEPFKPGYGGKAQLTINKDRHGGLRAASPSEDREPLAATFQLFNSEGDIRWTITAPAAGERPAIADVAPGDLRELSELDPPPLSQRDVKQRTGWGSTRALRALQEWRRQGSPTVLPRSSTPVWGAEEQSPSDAPRSAPRSSGSTQVEVSGIDSGAVVAEVLPAPHTPLGERGSTAEASICFDCYEPLHSDLVTAGILSHPGCEEVA